MHAVKLLHTALSDLAGGSRLLQMVNDSTLLHRPVQDKNMEKIFTILPAGLPACSFRHCFILVSWP